MAGRDARVNALKAEYEAIQKKTFSKWLNSQLSKQNKPPVTDLYYDLKDGTKLLTLLEILTNKKYASLVIYFFSINIDLTFEY